MEILKRVTKIDWRATLLTVPKGETRQCVIMASEANPIRIKASNLTREGKGNYSISIEGNIAIISNK